MMTTKAIGLTAFIIAAVVLVGNIVLTPAFASSASRHEFHHDVKQFLHCVKDNGRTHIGKPHFADCLTDNFNIHISKHTQRHL